MLLVERQGECWPPITRWGRVPAPAAGALWPGHLGLVPRSGVKQQHKPSLRGTGLISQMKPGAEGGSDPERGCRGLQKPLLSENSAVSVPPTVTHPPAPLGVRPALRPEPPAILGTCSRVPGSFAQ